MARAIGLEIKKCIAATEKLHCSDATSWCTEHRGTYDDYRKEFQPQVSILKPYKCSEEKCRKMSTCCTSFAIGKKVNTINRCCCKKRALMEKNLIVTFAMNVDINCVRIGFTFQTSLSCDIGGPVLFFRWEVRLLKDSFYYWRVSFY
jgi:hypothetical protein